MPRREQPLLPVLIVLLALFPGVALLGAAEAPAPSLRVGLARRDITPEGPIWLSGYAARSRPSERVDHRLFATAVCLQDAAGERVVLAAIDNCELSPSFAAGLQKEVQAACSLPEGAVIVVPSHTHSAPVLEDTLADMYDLEPAAAEAISAYSRRLRSAIVGTVAEALRDVRPSRIELGGASARFAMNRRVVRAGGADFGESPDAPADRDVPVLRISEPDGRPRAVLYGYACHGTSIWGEETYVVSGDYMAYARDHLEAAFPGVTAVYMTGFGADINPSPRGRLIHAKQHGLELAGAVASVLSRPMREVSGPLHRAYARAELPLAPPPSREKIEADSKSQDRHIRSRAQSWLSRLDRGEALPTSVSCPMEVVRLGDELTFLFMAGEVVVDYSVRMKREFAAESPWLVGYAFEVPCYIPSERILREGGYEADSSLIYYGLYGPLLARTEDVVMETFRELLRKAR